MSDFLDVIAQIIRVDIFVGFAFYSIVYVAITLWKRDVKPLEMLDVNSARFIVFSGLIYFFSTVAWAVVSFTGTIDEEGRQLRLTPYLQPLFWFLITQLFWIKKVRTVKILRVILSVLLVVSFEMYIIIVTSFHRDYLPSTSATASMNIFSLMTPLEMTFGITTKVALFCLLSTVFVFLVDKVKRSFRQA